VKNEEPVRFAKRIEKVLHGSLKAADIEALQVNLGRKCNLSCKHCHVEAGPWREELMSREHIDAVLEVLRKTDIATLDITGGAPELNPSFRLLVGEARALGKHVMVRSNLVIFFDEGMEDLPEFYAMNGVELVVSLPYYMEDSVDRVRGSGTFKKSIEAIRRLNRLGYGDGSGERVLNLVYNPQGAFLPPEQSSLEREYKRELGERYGITFDRLFTLANMPIGRFREFLARTGQLDAYMEKLSCAFNAENLPGLMCRHLIGVGWDGKLYDCDFNLVLGVGLEKGVPAHVSEFDYEALKNRKVYVDEHCLGCAAGQGST
jgi:radical SAM/Cys-rich protein